MGQNENVFRAEIGDGANKWAELVGQNGAEWAKWGLERGGTPGIYLGARLGGGNRRSLRNFRVAEKPAAQIWRTLFRGKLHFPPITPYTFSEVSTGLHELPRGGI